ncbi:hypothetical protein LJB90_00275 [Eubacteriales bacterium OttesenSCG-928-G02]|nr:hypothetical protein [Eubacteriales bacterium OttesenSCG-928-G02]
MTEAMKLIITISQRGDANKIVSMYKRLGAVIHNQFEAKGTATSEIMDMFGLATAEKDVIITMAYESTTKKIFNFISESNDLSSGIAMSVPMSGISNMLATAAGNLRKTTEEGDIDMDFKTQNNLVLVIVNQGYTEEVMNTAKRCGATGGTVIRARWAASEEIESFYGTTLQEEKEVIAILISSEQRNKMMEEINKEHGLKSKAQAAICSLPVDKASKLS